MNQVDQPGVVLLDPIVPPVKDMTLGPTVAVLRTSVLLPMTTSVAPGASEMGVPDTVMIPPGVRVCPSTVNPPDESAVYVCPLNVITAAVVGAPGGGEWLST